MSLFTNMLWDEGVEVEVPGSVSDLLKVLDQEVSQFQCQGYGFHLTPAKGSIGNNWNLIIRSVDESGDRRNDFQLGMLVVERSENDMVVFRIPPAVEQRNWLPPDWNPQERLFGSFVSQVLNSFQRRQLIELPGPLPEF